MKKGIIKYYPHAVLESCGDKKHKKGCYLRLKEDEIDKSIDGRNIILDFNKEGELMGIDWEDGI